MRAALIAHVLSTTVALGLSSCASSMMITADVDITGRYRLTSGDLHDIERVTLAAGITKPIRSIQADSPDRVRVECGMPWLREKEMILFTARRRSGHWFIDRSSIEKHYIITVE
jgi:hypothetical protein